MYENHKILRGPSTGGVNGNDSVETVEPDCQQQHTAGNMTLQTTEYTHCNDE